MSKIVLKVDFELEFYMCAISCHHMDYRLCWNLNKYLGLHLKKQTDYSLLTGKERTDHYSKYTFRNEIKKIDFTLVSNKGDHSFLVKEHPYFDYFLIVDGYLSSDYQRQILAQVQNIPEVLMGTEIDPNGLNSKLNLVFD